MHDWNGLQSNNIYLDYNYLKSIEKTVNEIRQFIYVLYYKEDKLIGKSIFQTLQYHTESFNFNAVPCNVGSKMLRFLLNKKLTLIIAGNIFASGENIYYFVDKISIDYAFKAINKVINQLFKNDKNINYILYKEFYPNNRKASILTKEYNYMQFNIDDDMFLDLKKDWNNFEDVLLEFKTKYRSRSKKVLQKSKFISVKEFTLEDINKNALKINVLFEEVLKKSDFNIGVFTLETFLSLKENLPSNYAMFGYYLDEKLIGFRTSFIHNKIMDASFIGIDYSVNLKYNLYQKILIDYVNYALINKAKSINFGRTAETIKSCVGATPRAMNLYVRSRKLTGRFLLRLIVNNIKPTVFSLRKPFKKTHYI